MLFSASGQGQTFKERLSDVEKNLAASRKETNTKVRGLREDVAAAKKRIEREVQKRQAEDKKVAGIMEEVAIGGLHLEMVGLVWPMLGVVCTSIPDRIAAWLSHLT